MEKIPVKLNELSPIIISLIEKVQMLDSTFLTKSQKLLITKEMLDTVDKFREFFVNASKSSVMNEQIQVFNKKIERAFSQFDWNSNVAVSPLEFEKFSENGKSLIAAVLEVLGSKGCGFLIIETYLKLCLKIVIEMTEKVNTDSMLDSQSFKALLEAILTTASIFKKYWHIVFLPKQKNMIIFCLHQICKALPLLLKMIETQNINVKNYALNIINKSLTKMLNNIYFDGTNQEFDCGQEFVKLMNFCVYKLNEISNYHNDLLSLVDKANETAEALKPTINELLCYVMSIAQVTNHENNYSSIASGAQKVLKEFNSMNNEIKNKNGSGIKLSANSVGESLCSLEHQVNVAVLKLVLEVFSGVNCPLKNIVNKCRTDLVKDNKASEDLTTLISEFDLEMDKIMQISFFAVSCTQNLNKILKIQSCLASFESLETELVPSLKALYMDCNEKNKINFQYFIEFWLQEITELKILIDSILDPASFSGVVLNQVKILVEAFKNDVTSNACLDKIKSTLKQIIQFSRKLIKTLNTNMDDEVQNEEARNLLKNFQLAVQECEAALNLIDKDKNINVTLNRGVKRCDLLLTTLNKLSLHLFDLISDETHERTSADDLYEEMSSLKVDIPKQNYYKLCEPDYTQSTPISLDILTPYINKEVLQSKRRNIFSTQTVENKNDSSDNFDYKRLTTTNWDKTPVSRKRSRCCKPLNFNLELSNSIDLEITTILENVSALSSTFNTIQTESLSKAIYNEGKIEKKFSDAGCGMEKDTDCVKPTFASRGCCANLEADGKESSETGRKDNPEAFASGSKISDRFLQSINDLCQNSSLSVAKDNDTYDELDTCTRLTDLKVVEQKINFLKQQLPGILP